MLRQLYGANHDHGTYGKEAMTTTTNVKSVRGLSDGVVSELATYWNVLPGHEDELQPVVDSYRRPGGNA